MAIGALNLIQPSEFPCDVRLVSRNGGPRRSLSLKTPSSRGCGSAHSGAPLSGPRGARLSWQRAAHPRQFSPAFLSLPSQSQLAKALPFTVTSAVPKIRRGGHVFIARRSDHPPRHVHVYRSGRLIVKWDLENRKPMKGKASPKILRLIGRLEAEGQL
jgi:hypothetical protein